MAKFLTTVGNSYHIEDIIIKATLSLYLITPYLKLSRNLLERLLDADRAGIKITLIYGKNELPSSEYNKLLALKNLEIYFCENLHAKCYHNENKMIISSMNLYEFSERNNREMGILIDKNEDSEIFNDTLKEIESIQYVSISKKKLLNENLHNEEKNETKKDSVALMLADVVYLKIIKLYPQYKFDKREGSFSISDFPSKGFDFTVGNKSIFIRCIDNNLNTRLDDIKYISKEISRDCRWDKFSYKNLYLHFPAYYEVDFLKPDEIISDGLLEYIKEIKLILEGKNRYIKST